MKDIDIDNFERIIKIALYASDGLLDVYQDITDEKFGELYRVTSTGERIILTDEDVEKMNAKDYDFILDESTS